MDHQGTVLKDVHPAAREVTLTLTCQPPGSSHGRKGKSVRRGDHLPGSQLGGVQDSVFAFPLNKRLGVPLGLTPQQRCVALVHGCTLWFHLEGDENWIGKDQRASRSCHSPSPANSGSHATPVTGHTCHGELDMGTDLALWLVGRNASVVASIVSGHSGKV